jgi:hypothetical protein
MRDVGSLMAHIVAADQIGVAGSSGEIDPAFELEWQSAWDAATMDTGLPMRPALGALAGIDVGHAIPVGGRKHGRSPL